MNNGDMVRTLTNEEHADIADENVIAFLKALLGTNSYEDWQKWLEAVSDGE